MAAAPGGEAGIMGVHSHPYHSRLRTSPLHDPSSRHDLEQRGPSLPSGASVATLENARYEFSGPSSSDHANEDRFFAMEGGNFQVMAVFDGHDGARAAGFASNYMLGLFYTQSWHHIVHGGHRNIRHALEEFFLAAERDFFQSIEQYTREFKQVQASIPAVSITVYLF